MQRDGDRAVYRENQALSQNILSAIVANSFFFVFLHRQKTKCQLGGQRVSQRVSATGCLR